MVLIINDIEGVKPIMAKMVIDFLKAAIMKDKTIVVSAAASALFITLAGCDTRKAHEEVRPVDWYESNPAERTAKLDECRASAGKLDATPNCVNASRAENNVKAAAKWGTEKEGVRTPATIND